LADSELRKSWQVFRFTLRDTAGEYAKAHLARIASLPLEPTDPERLAPVVHAVLAELDRDAAADEASPVLRAVRRTFRPSPEERERRRLKRSFDAFTRAWQAQARG
jgi:hypothetical protein